MRNSNHTLYQFTITDGSFIHRSIPTMDKAIALKDATEYAKQYKTDNKGVNVLLWKYKGVKADIIKTIKVTA